MRTFTQKLAFLLVTLLCCTGLQVKADELTVAENATGSSSYVPAYGMYADTQGARAQCLYPADSLSDMAGGTITKLTFYLSSPASEAWTGTFQLSLKETDATSLSALDETDLITVYTGGMDASGSTLVVEFNDAFTYSGGNLIIDWYVSAAGNYKSAYFTASSVTGAGRYRSSSSGSGSAADYLPKVTFEYTPGSGVACTQPESCDITDITASGATVNFSGGSGVYNVEYKAAGDADWTSAIKNTNQTSYTLSNLTPNTSYSVHVQCVCGDNTSSNKSASFRTLIGLPYTETFDATSAPYGWNQYTGILNDDGTATLSAPSSYSLPWSFGEGTSYGRIFGSSHAYGYCYYYSTASYHKWLVSPVIPMEADMQLTFNLALTNSSGNAVTAGNQTGYQFVVLASLDEGENWSVLRRWNNDGTGDEVFDEISSTGEEVEIVLPYTTESVQYAFHLVSSASAASYNSAYIHIDDVKIAPVPTCLKPTNLHEIESATTKSSLQIGWTANSEETAWRVQHKVSNDTTAEWITSDVSTNPYTINGLQPFTNYDIRVAAVCSESDFTDYGKTIVAKTASGVPYVEKFDTTTLPGEWKRYEVLSSELIYGDGQLQPVSNGWDVAAANGVFPAANRHLVLNITGANCKHWIVSPTIEVEAGYQLTFDLALTKAAGSSPVAVTPGAQNDDKFIVFISTDGGATWNEKAIWANEGEGFSYDAINPEGQTVKIDLSSYDGQGIKIAFYGESTDADSPSSSNLHIANVKIDLIPACSPALSLVITDLEATSATAVWTSDDAEANWQYGFVADPAADFAPADEDFANNTAALSAELTGLSEKTNYAFFLRRACEGTNSEPLVKNFRTPAMPIVLPWSENFDTLTSGIPEGWDNSEGTTTSASYKWSKYTDSGNTCLRFDSYSNYDGRTNVLATPRIYLSEDAILSFRWKNPTGGAGEVLISNDEGATRTALVSNLTGISDWNTYEIDLSAYTGSKVIIYFAATSNYEYGDAYLYLDDVAVAAAPDCLKPSGLQISEVTDTTAVIVWNEEADGSSWVYAVAPASAEEPADEAFQSVVVNSIALENLAYNTSYVFYLRKACGSAYSESISIAFKTLNPYELTVNDGTTTNSYVPLYGYYADYGTHSQFVIPAETLASMAWDTITNLTFYSSSSSISWGAARFEVYMAEVPATTLSAMTDWTALTKVMNEGALAIEDGKMEITLDAPFAYQGGNLLIGLHQTVGGTYSSCSWYGVSAPSGSSYYAYGSNNSSSSQSFLPKTTFGYRIGQVPPCATPADFHAVDSLATTTSVVLQWTQMSEENNFVIRYKVYGEEAFADSIFVLNDDSTTLTGLVPGTAYELQVAAWCDPADETAIGKYSASIYALTKCAAVETINQNFDGITEIPSNANKLPVCWSFINTNTSSSHNYYPTILESATFAHSGSNSLYFHSSAYASSNGPENQYAVLPEMTSVSDKRIKFYARPFSSGSNDPCFAVGVMTDPADTSTFVPVYTQCGYLAEYAPFVIPLDSYTGEGKFIAIKLDVAAQGGDYTHGLYIDDVVVEDIPACVDPKDLHAIADEITSSSALLAWTPQGAESDWLVRYRISGAADWADTIHVNNDTLLLENLAGATIYEAQVAAWCDPTDDEALSPFSSSISFATACGIYSITEKGIFSEGFEDYVGVAYNSASGVVPTCWETGGTTTYPAPHVVVDGQYAFVHDGQNGLNFCGSANSYAYAALPQFAEPLNSLQIGFWAKVESASYGNLLLGYVTSDDVSTFQTIATVPCTTTMKKFEYMLDTLPAAATRLVIVWEYSGSSYYSAGIDDIEVSLIPSCLKPQGLEVYDITASSAKFTWNVEEGNAYAYAVAAADEAEPADEAFAPATDSMQIAPLSASTDYILYLRTQCGESFSQSISAPFRTKMLPASVPYADDFEAGNNWMFINGGLTNAWAYGEADHNGEGTHAIYISNDGGASNAYNGNAPAVVYAVKSFDFEEGVYTFKYDWKANGEGTSTMYDYLRVFIVPESVELVPGTSLPTGLTATALPAAWNAIALDGGSAMNGVTSWQTFQTTEIAISAGRYKVVFLWRDDTSTANQTPAAIDNFSISKITCVPVSEFAVSGITSSAATISWTAPEEQDAWQLAYSADPNFDIAEATLIDVASTTYALADLLTDTLYNVYVRANCGSEDGVSVWSQISFRTAKDCQTPDDLVAAPGLNTAEISWNTYGQTGFNLRYIQGTDTTLVPNVASPYELTGLQANTAYKVQVQAACESEDSWSAAISFKTAYGIPFEEKFASTSAPDDWARYSGLLEDVLDGGALTTTTSGWNFGTGNGVFNNHAKINIYGTSYKYWLATPAVYVSGNVQLTFDLALTKFSGTLAPVEADAQADDKFAVLISTDNGANWSVLRLWDNAGSEYVYNNIACSATGEPIAIDLSAYDGQAIKIAFYGESTETGGDNNLHIDNVLIDLVPTCLKPTGFSISDVKAHSAQLNWTAGDEGQSAWQIAIDTIAAFNPDTLSNLIDVTENPYVLAGLAPETRYYAYVRANCGATDGVSRWTDVQTFKTTIACPAPSALKAVLTPGDGSIATLSWSAGAEENAWILEYSLNADLSDSIEVLAYDTFANLTGLTAEATYYARVKADCGELDGKSLYSAVISFKPTDAYELLLNDGTATNEYVPIYGYWTDNYTRSQFIIPAEQLESLEWDSLTVLTFYSSSTNTNWDATAFEVYVDEVPETTMTALTDWNAMTKVMNEASLNIIDNQMVITFDEAYQYQGGNLLIGIKQTASTTGTNAKHTYWYGVSANGASFGGYGDGNNVAQRNFLPKMLINYVPGVAPACPNPKNLVVSGITDSEATFSWKAVEGATWEYALVEGAAEPASFIATTENTVTLNELAEATDYTFYLRRACGEDGYSDATISVAFTTELHMETLPFEEDFEANAHAWKFVNGEQPNAWTIGNAASNGGDNALYISNDGGVSNAYTNDVAVASFATVLIDFNRPGTFTFAYDWKAKGDYNVEENEQYDYLRVVLVPASAVLTAGTPSLPEGYIALDGGGLYGVTEWQHYVADDVEVVPGQYKLVFAWFNDESDGEDTPAAIDNISIKHKDNPTDIQSGAGIENKAVKFIYNNQVYILLNGNVYNITGQKVELR